MSKEMMIIFVYDMEYCKSEEDDPASAILYFYPNWVSDQQKTNLCGQIMGTTHFFKSAFSCPKILALQSGKFCIKEFGRFILAVGTDRNIDDWVLQHRADTLTSFINFFHMDLANISLQFQNYVNFSEKLYNMFETYLRILQYSGNIFANVPVLQLPKSANSVFLEAIQIMQYCQEMKFVLGGTLLYHNKVLATQLSSDLTKRIVMTDPYRIKSPAEVVVTDYSLPLGVQLLQVYISKHEFKNLVNSVNCLRAVCQNSGKNYKKAYPMKSVPKEPILSVMKRDQSLIFTTVPEEDVDYTSPVGATQIPPVPPIKSIDRPKSLNLKSIPKSTDAQNTVCTPFTGQTSVCSTPMTEKFLHDNPLSICRDVDKNQEIDSVIKPKDDINGKLSILSSMNSQKTADSESVNSVLSALNCNPESTKLKNEHLLDDFKFPISNLFVPANLVEKKHCTSSTEINKLKTTNKIMMRYYGLGLTKLNFNESNQDDECHSKYHLFNTITDPTYPVFRSDGLTVSKPLYDIYLAKQCELYSEFNDIQSNEGTQLANATSSLTNTEDWKSLDDFDCDNRDTIQKCSEVIEENISNSITKHQDTDRRSLSLPLKSLNSDQNNEISISTFNRRSLGGVQLTPLMSKLSLLAMEDRSSGFCSRDTTPSEFRDFCMTPVDKNYSFNRKNSLTADKEFCEDSDSPEDQEYEKVVLLICGQRDMVMGLLIEEEGANCQELVTKIWEVCTESLGKLEAQLRHCLDPQPVGNLEHSESYSYLCVDPEWDTSQRGGPWGATELGALTHLHRDFCQTNNLFEITLRNEDSIIYGYRCGETEVFYQQSASATAGLPPPADAMGIVPLKARRKLERDHAIILL